MNIIEIQVTTVTQKYSRNLRGSKFNKVPAFTATSNLRSSFRQLNHQKRKMMIRFTLLLALIASSTAFAPCGWKSIQTSPSRLCESNGEYDPKREQELILESMSLKGADVVARMDIPERAKRAMLAEAVEDRIFQLTEMMEELIDEDGMIAETNREKAVELAQATKSLQGQYQNLVSGKESSILELLASKGKEE